MRRHGFSIKKRTHGTHEVFRHGGSIGPGSYPGRVIKGLRMPGHMGDERVTTLNIEVVRVDPEKRLLFVRGGVPGHNDAIVRVRPSVRARASVRPGPAVARPYERKDRFHQRAKREGFRSRAAYKLHEIQRRTQVLRRGAARDRPGLLAGRLAPGGGAARSARTGAWWASISLRSSRRSSLRT